MCYLIAKKFDAHGCLAVRSEYGAKLASLVDYLSRETTEKNIQILTISTKEAFGEYAPYKELSSEKEFILKVLSM